MPPPPISNCLVCYSPPGQPPNISAGPDPNPFWIQQSSSVTFPSPVTRGAGNICADWHHVRWCYPCQYLNSLDLVVNCCLEHWHRASFFVKPTWQSISQRFSVLRLCQDTNRDPYKILPGIFEDPTVLGFPGEDLPRVPVRILMQPPTFTFYKKNA